MCFPLFSRCFCFAKQPFFGPMLASYQSRDPEPAHRPPARAAALGRALKLLDGPLLTSFRLAMDLVKLVPAFSPLVFAY